MTAFRLFALTTLFFSACCSVQAAEPFDADISLDTLEALAGGKAYQGLPDGFPFSATSGIEVIGHVVNNMSSRIVLSSELDATASLSALGSALTGAGWSVFSAGMPGAGRGGFVSPGQSLRVSDTGYCHEDFGTILPVSEAGGTITINLVNSSYAPMMNCQDMSPAGAGQPFAGSARSGFQELSSHLPTLELPEGTGSQMPAMSGSSGSMNEVTTSLSVESDIEAGELARHFFSQIVEQGWQLDSDWQGSLGAGSNWMKQTEDGAELFGQLNIVKVAQNQLQMQFRVRKLGAASSTATVRGIFGR